MKTPIDTTLEPAGRIAKRKWPPYYNIALAVLPMFAGCLAFVAMLNIQESLGVAELAKSVLVSAAVILVSYTINRFAIEWSTDLAASGMVVSGCFGAATILLVGACLWLFSFSGWVLPDVRHLTLANYGQELSAHVSERISQSQRTIRVVPVIKGAATEFEATADCEFQSACISGRGSGPGPVWRALNERSDRAKSIVEQVRAGEKKRDTIVAELLNLVGKYHETLDDPSLSRYGKRRELQTIDAQIRKTLAELDEAVPGGLIESYAQELSTGVELPGRKETSLAVSALLKKYADAIRSTQASINTVSIESPAFPRKPGMSDSVSYIGHFLAIAGIIWVAEGIFPLALFLYTLWYLQRLQQLKGSDSKRHEVDHIQTRTNRPKQKAQRHGGSHHHNGRA